VEVEGERDNVMGLPVNEVRAALRRHAAVSERTES
jgi:predicted house-cleaning NTP pyrophosphatase (Maf/HAM1 superfamily)